MCSCSPSWAKHRHRAISLFTILTSNQGHATHEINFCPPSDVAAARDFLRSRFNHGESVVFIAHEGETPVGFAQLYPSFSSVSLARVFVLNDLFVHTAGRRKGVASQLLAAIEAYATSLDAVRITLLVAKPNTTAQALYASRGWKQDEHFLMYHRYPG